MRAILLKEPNAAVRSPERDEILASNRTRFGAPSASSAAERAAGCQNSSSISPIGVPGPTRVSRSLSALLNIYRIPAR